MLGRDWHWLLVMGIKCIFSPVHKFLVDEISFCFFSFAWMDGWICTHPLLGLCYRLTPIHPVQCSRYSQINEIPTEVSSFKGIMESTIWRNNNKTGKLVYDATDR